MTAGRIAFALGTVGVGALIGGAVADAQDKDVAKGALIGGASALAGLALLYGGAYAWKQFSAARTGATAGAQALTQTLAHAPVTPTAATTLTNTASRLAPTATTAAATTAAAGTIAGGAAATTTAAAATSTAAASSTTAATGWRAWISNLFHEAPSVTTLRPLPVTVPTIARTPVLPVATTTSGSTFIGAMSQFLPRV